MGPHLAVDLEGRRASAGCDAGDLVGDGGAAKDCGERGRRRGHARDAPPPPRSRRGCAAAAPREIAAACGGEAEEACQGDTRRSASGDAVGRGGRSRRGGGEADGVDLAAGVGEEGRGRRRR